MLQFWASGSQFLFGLRIWGLVVDFMRRIVDFRSLSVDLGALGVISPLGIYLRRGLNFSFLVSGSRFRASVSRCWTQGFDRPL